jgi:hypothetical protein
MCKPGTINFRTQHRDKRLQTARFYGRRNTWGLGFHKGKGYCQDDEENSFEDPSRAWVMKQSRKSVLIGAVIEVVAVILFACPGGFQGLVYRMQIGLMVKSFDTSIDFFGQVVDQHGDPVEGARIAVGIRHFSLIGTYFMGSTKLEVATDQGGFFEISGYRGSDLFIDGISKDGFEYILSQNRESFFDYGRSVERPFIPDENDPVIFRLRKKHLGRTFLFLNRDWGIGVNRDGSGEDRAFDLVEQKRTRPANSPPREKWSALCDLRYRATFDEDSGEWEVVFSTCGTGSGIFASDEKLYEAPVGDYGDEWSFMARDMVLPTNHFLYVQSRTPSINSRVEITDVRVTREHVRIYGNSATNPYGDRALDSVDLDRLTSHQQVVLEARLKAEARTMLGDGRLPSRPRIMTLIEAVKRGEKRLEDLERETQEWKTEKNPNYTHQYRKRAKEKMERRDFEGAIEEWDEYLRRVGEPPSDLAYSDKGAALEQIGDFEGALRCYRTAVEEFPERTFFYGHKMVRIRKKNW